MTANVKLSASLVEQAKHHARAQHRSVPKQIEYRSRIGKAAEENPDLPFAMIRDILIAQQEEAVEVFDLGAGSTVGSAVVSANGSSGCG